MKGGCYYAKLIIVLNKLDYEDSLNKSWRNKYFVAVL
jgi:hypothetical protein